MAQEKIHSNQAERQRAYRARQAEQRAKELNRKNLPALPKIAAMPGTARWNALIGVAVESLQAVRDEMQNYAGERSETWQESDKAEEFNDRLSAVEEILGLLEEL
jgi:hypothetical protein